MRNYLDNQRELINTHKQYLELNNLYQQNITTYMNSILINNGILPESNHNNTDDEIISNATYDLSDNTNNNNIQYNVENAQETANVENAQETANVGNTQDNLVQRPIEQIIQEHNDNMQTINDNRERRHRNRRRRYPHFNVETHNAVTNLDNSVSNNERDYSNMSVPTTIINQECDIIHYCSQNTSQDMCPIDRAPFEENERVMRIRFCGHIFRELNLRENFRSRATCPVCRHNIITTVTNRNHSSDNIEWFIRY